MQVRDLQPGDIPILREMHAKSGLQYDFPNLQGPHMEAVKVVVDEHGRPKAAAAAERILQAYLFCDEFEHPAAKLAAIRLLHMELAPALRAKGYSALEAFIPPILARFTRRLKTWGWFENWPSFCIKF